MPRLYQHKQDGTYFTRLYLRGASVIVTRQIHPDGLRMLKHNGVRLEGDIPPDLIDELQERNWLFTKEEVPYGGVVDWAPHWHLIDAPKPKPFPRENPFVTKKRREAEAAAEAARRAAEEAEQQVAKAKREARRERQRRYRARKRAEAEAARLAAAETGRKEAAIEPWPQLAESTDADSIAATSIPQHQVATHPVFDAPPATDAVRHGDPRSVAAENVPRSAAPAATPPATATGEIDKATGGRTERRSPWSLAVVVAIFVLLVMIVGQLLDAVPL